MSLVQVDKFEQKTLILFVTVKFRMNYKSRLTFGEQIHSILVVNITNIISSNLSDHQKLA